LTRSGPLVPPSLAAGATVLQTPSAISAASQALPARRLQERSIEWL
jgi:hypothetical protein